MSSAPERRPVTIRRAPKIIPFLVLGALAGLIAAGILAFTGPEGTQFSRGTVLGFFSALLLIPGLLLGAVVALVFDWMSVRRSRRAMAESTNPGPRTPGPADADNQAAAADQGNADNHGAVPEKDGGHTRGPDAGPDGQNRDFTYGDDAGNNR